MYGFRIGSDRHRATFFFVPFRCWRGLIPIPSVDFGSPFSRGPIRLQQQHSADDQAPEPLERGAVLQRPKPRAVKRPGAEARGNSPGAGGPDAARRPRSRSRCHPRQPSWSSVSNTSDLAIFSISFCKISRPNYYKARSLETPRKVPAGRRSEGAPRRRSAAATAAGALRGPTRFMTLWFSDFFKIKFLKTNKNYYHCFNV